MVKRKWLIPALLFFAFSAHAQISEHQRLGVEKKIRWDAAIETGTSLKYEEEAGVKAFHSDCFLSLDFSLARTWLLNLYVPLDIETVSIDYFGNSTACGIGDFDLSIGFSNRLGNIRYNIFSNIGFPTGYPYYIPDGPLLTGSGRWRLGLNTSASIIFDPVLIGLSLGYNMGLAKKERYGTSWDPGNISLSLGITEVLNDSIGYSLRVQQNLSLPLVYEGYSDSSDYSYRISGAMEVFYNTEQWSIRTGLSKSLNAWSEPVVFTISFTWNIDSETFGVKTQENTGGK